MRKLTNYNVKSIKELIENYDYETKRIMELNFFYYYIYEWERAILLYNGAIVFDESLVIE